LTSLEKGKTLAENGGLDAELEPDGVFGIWNAGALQIEERCRGSITAVMGDRLWYGKGRRTRSRITTVMLFILVLQKKRRIRNGGRKLCEVRRTMYAPSPTLRFLYSRSSQSRPSWKVVRRPKSCWNSSPGLGIFCHHASHFVDLRVKSRIFLLKLAYF